MKDEDGGVNTMRVDVAPSLAVGTGWPALGREPAMICALGAAAAQHQGS